MFLISFPFFSFFFQIPIHISINLVERLSSDHHSPMMNRFTFEEKEMARVMLIASRQQAMPVAMRGDRAPERAFVCKTCGRVFPSFQALGGHRASHKKPRLDGDGGDLKPKLHGCSICGLEFAIGQALGGHMRRHRAMVGGGGDAMPPVAANKMYSTGSNDVSFSDGNKRGLWLDLNQPPCFDDGCMDVGADQGECGHDVAAPGYTFHQFLDTGTMAVDCV
jgi:hypothetical protein